MAFAFEPLMGALVSGAIGAWSLSGAIGLQKAEFFVLHLLLWSACDFLQMRKLDPGLRPSAVLAWFGRELLALPLWIHIASGSTVNWRGNRLRVRSGGILAE
jgi:ceramide glucosyltransferase